ncbi:MAG TPA: DNA repair protein RadC [Longimicrobiales bacterium]|nr:DNA repair protein RadC [Longimicrobiales bacterium]
MAGYAIREWPAPERPRERLHAAGAGALASRELLAILVGSGREGASAVDIAGSMLRGADGSLRRLATASAAELAEVPGVGPAVAARVSAALELGRRLAREGPLERTRIRGPLDVYERCAPGMRDLSQEEFRVLLLNTQHAVVREIAVTRGTLDTSVVHPREVFRAAITESAASMILVHNHPSGDPTPSPEDREVTRQLAEAGRLLGIAVLDHVVIGDGRYISFVEAGLGLPL